MEKGLLNIVHKGPLGMFQILVGTGREGKVGISLLFIYFFVLWLAATVLYFLSNFLECRCSYILYKWYFGANSRIADVNCLKTDTDPKKMAFLIHLILILELLDVLRSHFRFSVGELKPFKFGVVIFPLTGDMFIWWCWSGYWARSYESWNSVLEGFIIIVSLQPLKCLSGDNSEYLTWAEFFV